MECPTCGAPAVQTGNPWKDGEVRCEYDPPDVSRDLAALGDDEFRALLIQVEDERHRRISEHMERCGFVAIDEALWVSESRWYNPFTWGKGHWIGGGRP